MEPKTCPHTTCGYTWTPRKAEPRKCPQCQNSLWQSPRPKRKRPEHVLMNESTDKVMSGETSWTMPEESASPTIEKDSLSDAKARAEELLRQLTV